MDFMDEMNNLDSEGLMACPKCELVDYIMCLREEMSDLESVVTDYSNEVKSFVTALEKHELIV